MPFPHNPIPLGFANEVRSKASNLLTVQHMNSAQLLDHAIVELAERNMHERTSKSLGNSPPSGPWSRRAQEGHLLGLRMHARGCDQSIFQRVDEIERFIGPDIEDRARWVQEIARRRTWQPPHPVPTSPAGNRSHKKPASTPHRARQTTSFAMGRYEDPPGSRKGSGKRRDDRPRRLNLDIEVAVVPMPKRLADVDPIHHAGREFFRSRKVCTHARTSPLDDPRSKALDDLVLGRPRTLPIRIPLHLPFLGLVDQRLAIQFDRPPFLGRSAEPIDQGDLCFVGQSGLVDPHRHRGPRQFIVVRIFRAASTT